MSKRENIKRLTAMGCAAAMLSSLTACGENTTWGAEADGVKIPAGVFIYYLDSANYDAQSKLKEQEGGDLLSDDGSTETKPMVYTADIDGKPAKQWIYDEATDSMKEYAVVEAKFLQYGLTLTDEDTRSISNYVDQMWDYMGEYYTLKGVSQNSYKSVFYNTVKNSKLFDAIYSEGGEKGVPDSEIKSYLGENFAMINYIHVEYKDGEGNILKSEGKEERRKMLESYMERYKNGESFDALNAEYVAYYDKLKADAEAAAAAAENGETPAETPAETTAETTVETTAETPAAEVTAEEQTETANAEVETSPAEAALDGEGENLTGAEEETQPADENAAETEESSETEAPAETAAPEASETAEGTSSETAQTEEQASAVSEGLTDVSAVSSNQTVIEKSDGTLPCKEVAERVFGGMNNGDIEIIETADGDNCYLVLKMDILETDEYFNSAKSSLLHEMKEDDFKALIEQWKSEQNFIKNQEAYDRYDPEKMFKAG